MSEDSLTGAPKHIALYSDPVLAKLEPAVRHLQEATTLTDIKAIVDVARTAEVYARRRKLGEEAIRYATSIKDLALIKLGTQMEQAPKNEGTRGNIQAVASGGSDRNPPVDTSAPTYHQLGIDKKTANAARKLARLAKERPDLADLLVTGEVKQAEALRQMRKAEVAKKVAELPPHKYRVLYADPPWAYSNSGAISDTDHYSRVERHYPAMSLADLCSLGVKAVAASDAVLFLWTTSAMLESAFEVIRAWGFKYRSSFVWDKVRHNHGYYNSIRHELLLVCTRGTCTPDVDPNAIDSVQVIERGKHSEKPERFREIIDTLYPHGPRIELFRRGEAPPGWAVWGAEVVA